jgi:hypothetical protein
VKTWIKTNVYFVCTIESALSFLCGSSIDFSEYLYLNCYNRTIFKANREIYMLICFGDINMFIENVCILYIVLLYVF